MLLKLRTTNASLLGLMAVSPKHQATDVRILRLSSTAIARLANMSDRMMTKPGQHHAFGVRN